MAASFPSADSADTRPAYFRFVAFGTMQRLVDLRLFRARCRCRIPESSMVDLQGIAAGVQGVDLLGPREEPHTVCGWNWLAACPQGLSDRQCPGSIRSVA